MTRTLALILRAGSVPVGVLIGLWTAQLTTISSTYQCVGRCLPPSLFPTFAPWQCALFGAATAVGVLLLSVAVTRFPQARMLKTS
jgi:hypothetical protein